MVNFFCNTVQAHIFYFNNKKNEYQTLILQRSASEAVYPNVWQTITGTIDEGEKAWETAIREIIEESGLKPVEVWTVPFIATFFNPYKNQISSAPVFACLVNNTNVVLSDEHQDFKWLSINDAYHSLQIPSHKEGIKTANEFILLNPQKNIFELKLNWQLFAENIYGN